MINNLQKTASEQNIPVQVLNPYNASKKYNYRYIQAAEDLRDFVESHWAMDWDLSNQPSFKLELASSPFVAFTFTQYGCFLTGISTKVFQYTLSGKGSLYGTLFKPGGFHCLYQKSVEQLTDKEMVTSTVFPSFNEKFNTSVLSAKSDKAAIKLIEQGIRELPRQDSGYALLLQEIIRYATDNPTNGIKLIADKFGMSERRLQELFHDQVGVGLKWIVMRERLQSVMAIAAHTKTNPDWTAIAQELGYNDQPHFINDFKRIVGITPKKYYAAINNTRDLGG